MIALYFSGWFQVRLAIDPDPVDEPRGVSGICKALPGEPDFDRILQFHPSEIVRTRGPKIGVWCTHVTERQTVRSAHPLQGAPVTLEDAPVFAGHNGIIADDGDEPIVPFHIKIQKGPFVLFAQPSPEVEEFPFTKLRSTNGLVHSPTDIAMATGIHDIQSHLEVRRCLLEKELEQEHDETKRYVLDQRIKFLAKWKLPAWFFQKRMFYSFPLEGKNLLNDPHKWLPFKSEPKFEIDFWVGGWDPDANCAFISGSISEKTF